MASPDRPSRKPVAGCLLLALAVLGLTILVAKYGGYADTSDHGAPAPTPAPSPQQVYQLGLGHQEDTVYAATLRNSPEHLAYVGYEDSDLVRIGHNICAAIDAGSDLTAAALAVGVAGADLDAPAASRLTLTAVGAYCPEYLA